MQEYFTKKSEPFISEFFELCRSFLEAPWFIYFILHNIKIVTGNFPMLYCTVKIITEFPYILLRCKIVTGNFPLFYCCKDYKNVKRDKKFLGSRCFVCFWGFVSSLLKYKWFFKLAERKFHFPKYKKLFKSEFFLLFKLGSY